MIQFILDNKAVVLAALLGVSEVMALVPGIKSSGIFDFIYRALKSVAGK
jgi:Mg2+/citrate symporter